MSNIPEKLYYSKEHEWAKVEGDNAVIGITDFAQDQLTDIVYVEVPEIGTKLAKDETFGVVESVKSVSDVFSPLSGEIIEFNEIILDQPEIINKDPYGKGWFIKIKLSNKSELESLLTPEQYRKLIEGE